jgi:hypothetical protein
MDDWIERILELGLNRWYDEERDCVDAIDDVYFEIQYYIRQMKYYR